MVNGLTIVYMFDGLDCEQVKAAPDFATAEMQTAPVIPRPFARADEIGTPPRQHHYRNNLAANQLVSGREHNQ